MKFLSLAAMLVLAAACDRQPTDPAAAREPGGLAPLRAAAPGKAIPGAYIVVLQDGTNPSAVAAAVNASPRYTWTAALHGFAATLNPGQLNALQHNPRVKYIEEDQMGQIDGTQYGAPWGLDRIDQHDRPTNGTFVYERDGSGVHAYVLDTGIRASHVEFGGRASVGYDAVGDGQNGNDCNGHGTHVAGTLGGATYGVAKGVTIVAVRVATCGGGVAASTAIAGFNWVAAHRVLPAVANASFGNSPSQAEDDAVNGMINSGVTLAASAGNNNGDACQQTPSRVPAALTVGATGTNDARAVWTTTPNQASNYGTCVDLFAPGSGILSAWNTSNTASDTLSGTSMASPHVAGVAAQYLQDNPTATPANVAATITGFATLGKVTNAGSGSPNRLLYSRLPLPAPNVTVTYPGGVPTLSWPALTGAQQYSVTLTIRHVSEDAYDGNTVFEDNEWLGITTDNGFVDSGRSYTGAWTCILNQSMYGQQYDEYYYDVEVTYPESTRITRVTADVGQCAY
ncbi:S8 family peptidase [Longimicrobium sp.]|uniref:S8 family peptidase n=1 Tax=Longimicrobium sp. TaxID=2029185 RepID=UPI002D7E9509|nr:S8 family serine peptidase [Longimicrobium sp.]